MCDEGGGGGLSVSVSTEERVGPSWRIRRVCSDSEVALCDRAQTVGDETRHDGSSNSRLS
jgi:hypothetical protein